ncbi:hypothetical protein LLE87_31415, partial [Paenibacillus polymyxa]|nr:hypothetical protein [Paenibacillus polymyxa]
LMAHPAANLGDAGEFQPIFWISEVRIVAFDFDDRQATIGVQYVDVTGVPLLPPQDDFEAASL